jgi:rubrerythrin
MTFAAPGMVKRADVDDTTVLQYALTLEHLENAFYSGALAKFDAAAFEKAGYPSWVRDRFVQIGKHEESHVAFLQKVLGDSATKPCTYNFPYTDPKSFAALSQALEGTGTSAYLGAAKFISNKDYLTAAGAILTTEARHDAWVASAVQKGAAWNTAYDTPLGFNGVYSIASQFIKSCPDSNPTLPVTAYPAFSFAVATPAVGQKVKINFDNKNNVSPLYVAYYSGLNVFFSDVGSDGTTTIPSDLANTGTVYASVVSSNSGVPTDSTTLSGFTILYFGISSKVTQ